MFLRIARDPSRYFSLFLASYSAPTRMNRQPRPATPNTQRLFGRIKAKPHPDHYGLVTTPRPGKFQRPSRRLVGIIEDFPVNRDQICLIIAQSRSGPTAMEGWAGRHGHDIGMAPRLFQRRWRRHLYLII
jgi:hypothetical protein